jgi:hypothetical protein
MMKKVDDSTFAVLMTEDEGRMAQGVVVRKERREKRSRSRDFSRAKCRPCLA